MLYARLSNSKLAGVYSLMPVPASITHAVYGTTADGIPVYEYTLTNPNGLEVKIINYGGIITSIKAPDRNGQFANIALGFDNFADYEAKNPNFGCITGRYANRIAAGKFTLDGQLYQLPINDGQNTLHGGYKGFDKVIWAVEAVPHDANPALKLRYHSPDGEEGFPANLDVVVTYTLTAENALHIDYQATPDQSTVINLTNHSYFNLAGEGAGSIEGHILTLFADAYTPVGAGLIPTGEIAKVEGTALDFRQPKPIGQDLRSTDAQMIAARGYDHNFVLKQVADDALILAAQVLEPSSGRILEVWTTEPAIQFYSGNFLDGTLVGTSGRPYRQSDGFALETQHYPDSPNQPHFPSTRVDAGVTYRSSTIYKFLTD